MTRAVLWDMDGVLVDTGPLHFQTWKDALAPMGVALTPELFRATFGMNNVGVLTTLLGRAPEPELAARVGDAKELAFREAIRGQARPLPGVVTWLRRLRAQGFRQAVASSGPPENIAALIDELGLRPYFDALVSGAGHAGKPDPYVFVEAARQLGVKPAGCVVVEDAVTGVEAARRAGMGCIAVTNTNPASALGAADVVVDNLEDLPEGIFSDLLADQKRG